MKVIQRKKKQELSKENESKNPDNPPNSNSSGCGSILVVIFLLSITGFLLSTTVGL